jgi:hypothetical protein
MLKFIPWKKQNKVAAMQKLAKQREELLRQHAAAEQLLISMWHRDSVMLSSMPCKRRPTLLMTNFKAT